MLGTAKSTDDLLVSRHECKYFVSLDVVDALRAQIQPYVRPDAFARDQPGHRYRVCSLYLDSPDLRLHRMTVEGIKSRFKLRVRSYADGPDEPAYLEIKKRHDAIVIKRRARLSSADAAALVRSIEDRSPVAGLYDNDVAGEFRSHGILVGARPIARIRYVREAYESATADPVRITFDTDVECAITDHAVLGVDGSGWRATPTEGVILEIKFTDVYPAWIRSIVEAYQLGRRSIPKYGLSMDAALREGWYLPSIRFGRSTIGAGRESAG